MEVQLISERHGQELPVLKSILCLGASPGCLVTTCYLGPSLQVPVACVPPQGPFWHSVDTKAEKRLAGRKERRSRFGDVNVHKRYQLGKIFSPFQALATTVSPLLLGKAFRFLFLLFKSFRENGDNPQFFVFFKKCVSQRRPQKCRVTNCSKICRLLPWPPSMFLTCWPAEKVARSSSVDGKFAG